MMPANAKQRIKWTAKMQEDVLEYKRRAYMNLINLVRMEREEAMSSECWSFGLKRDMVIWV